MEAGAAFYNRLREVLNMSSSVSLKLLSVFFFLSGGIGGKGKGLSWGTGGGFGLGMLPNAFSISDLSSSLLYALVLVLRIFSVSLFGAGG